MHIGHDAGSARWKLYGNTRTARRRPCYLNFSLRKFDKLAHDRQTDAMAADILVGPLPSSENAVGIGGSYLCVYGMEGPGGYQFVGRTLQMWNRWRRTTEFEQPWLLRFFDQIRFFPVDEQELLEIREQFPRGAYRLRIEESTFRLDDYNRFLADNRDSICPPAEWPNR